MAKNTLPVIVSGSVVRKRPILVAPHGMFSPVGATVNAVDAAVMMRLYAMIRPYVVFYIFFLIVVTMGKGILCMV